MTKKEAIDLLIAHAVCCTPFLDCTKHCPYKPGNCDRWNEKKMVEAVKLLVGDTEQKKTCDNCANKRRHPDGNRHEECEICVYARYEDGTFSDPSHWRAKTEKEKHEFL